ncbi:MAG: Wzz/FepE/Etk N-terminal domain-containing protein [Woeseiaceae bacterium]
MPEPDVNDSIIREPESRRPSEGYAIRLYPIDETEEIRLIDLWRVIWAGKWLILSSSVLVALATTIAAFLITPVYRAEVVLAPVAAQRSSSSLATLAGQLGGIATLAGINLGTDESSAEAIAILRSRALTERFIEKNKLLPVLFSEDWDQASGTWHVDDPDDIPNMWRAYERFDKSIRSVSQDVETGLVTLTIDWVDPQRAREWANGLVEEVNADTRGRAIEQSKKNIDYLRGQLQDTDELELRASVFDLMEAEMKNAMLSAVRTEFAFSVIDPAVVPEKMRWPNRMLFGVLGFFAGMLLGVLAVFLRRSAARGA